MSEGSGSRNQATLRYAKLLEQQADSIVKSRGGTIGIGIGVPIMPEKTERGTKSKREVTIETNVYNVSAKNEKEVYIYRYDVRIIGITSRGGREVDLTGPITGDKRKIDRRALCRDILSYFINHHSIFKNVTVAYDLCSILFASSQLPNVNQKGVELSVRGNEVQNSAGLESFRMHIKETEENFRLTVGEFENAITRNLEEVDRSYAQFINILTSQYMCFTSTEHITFSASESYLLNPANYGFTEKDTPQLTSIGGHLRVGCDKSTRFVEGIGAADEAHCGLVITCKKRAFHNSEFLHQKILSFYPRNRLLRNFNDEQIAHLNRALRGLSIVTYHTSAPRNYVVRAISSQSTTAVTKYIEREGEQISVADYFQQKYNIKLSFPNSPLVISRAFDGRETFMPMELCKVAEHQRVSFNQQTPQMVADQIKACAVAPYVLREQIAKTVDSTHLADNETLTNMGTRFSNRPLVVSNARVLEPPRVIFANQSSVSVDENSFTWTERHFLVPASIKNWCVIAAVAPGERLDFTVLDNFIQKFMTESQSRGMTCNAPFHREIVTSARDLLEHKLQALEQRKCVFVMLIQSKEEEFMHHELKLAEREHRIITQGLNVGTVRRVAEGSAGATLRNIVQKSNVKLGGLNYSLITDKYQMPKGLLCIGIGASHTAISETELASYGGPGSSNGENGNGSGAGRTSRFGPNESNGFGILNPNWNDHSTPDVSKYLLFPPSVLGYSANVGHLGQTEFVGDFMLQEPRRDEKPELIARIVAQCINQYMENNGNKLPENLLIYRNGCDEGSFKKVLKYEVPMIKIALKELKCNAKLTMLVPTKLHNIRFFQSNISPSDTPMQQNVIPGTVVDSCVVHPTWSEFYLNPHRALRGTAKTPRFTVLVNDSAISMNDLETLTYQLCYAHQIVYSPTSLPTPSYVANLYAERGRNLFTKWWDKKSTSLTEDVTLLMMEHQLSFLNVDIFRSKRINA